MLISLDRLLPFLKLQGRQAATTLFQLVLPPRDLGITWSKVKSCDCLTAPQYWQENLSLKKTLNLVKTGDFLFLTYSFKEITLGTFIENPGDLTTSSYSETIFTLSRNTAFIVSCHDQSDNGK